MRHHCCAEICTNARNIIVRNIEVGHYRQAVRKGRVDTAVSVMINVIQNGQNMSVLFLPREENKMALLDKLNSISFRTEKIKAPEIGDGAELILRELTAGQHADFIDKLKDEEFRGSEKRLTAFMIMNCLVDENGNREIQDEEQAMAVMEKLPQRLIRRINVALAKLNNSDTEEKKR